MSHRDAPAAAPRRRWWWPGRRARRIVVPEHLWPLIERTAAIERTTPQAWVLAAAGQAASARMLGRLPPQPGPGAHPQQWRQAVALLARAEDVHYRAVQDGLMEDLDGRWPGALSRTAPPAAAGARRRPPYW